MIRKATLLVILALPLGAAQCGQADLSRVAPLEVTGEPESCIPTSRIENTVVRDDETIDFEMAGGGVYRNTLPNRCHSLGFEKAFVYETSASRLCGTDTIRVLYSDGEQGQACGLGEFLPVSYPTEAE